MSSSPLEGVWPSIAPYVVPPLAASFAIVAATYDMVAKSFIQQGLQVPKTTMKAVLQSGLEAAPAVGAIVGTQMVLQGRVEQALVNTFPHLFAEDSNKASLKLASSMAVGALSSPFLAVYNGKTMTPPWTAKMSLSKFSPKQAGAITLQETGFVAGIAAADLVAKPMKELLGDNKAVEYSAAGVAGAVGSLFGHAGNTALTRWQNAMTVDSLGSLSLGALRKARGNALFTMVYKLATDVLNSTVEDEK